MNKKDLYDSLEKERDRMLHEDEGFQDSSKRLSDTKEREILGQNKPAKISWFRNKKLMGLAAAVAVVLLAGPAILSMMSMFNASSSFNSASDYNPADMETAESSEASTDGQAPEIIEVVTDSDRKLVYRFEYNIETKEYEKSLSDLNLKVKEYGGFVESSSYDNTSRRLKVIDMTIRIPKENSEDFQASLGQIGGITYQAVSTDDLSKIYADTSNQVEVLQAKEARYIELLDQAESIEDILAIEGQLAEVQAQLKFMNQDLKNIDYDVDYNTFNIHLYEVEKLDIGVNEKESFSARLANAFRQSLENFTNFVQNFILFLARNLIFIAVLAVIVVVLLWVVKRRRLLG